MPPRFSVITVSYNDAAGLRETLRTTARQTYPGFEQIVVDGGSPYPVADLVAQENPAARLVSERDDGIYDAMNKGIALATGDYLIFMNSGDVFADDDVLQMVESRLGEGEADLVYGDAFERLLTGTVIRKRAKPITRAAYGMITHHQAMFFRNATIKSAGLRYDQRFRSAADYKLFIEVLGQNHAALYIDLPICIFSQGGVSHTEWHLSRREQFVVRKEAFGSVLFASYIYVVQAAQGYVRRWFPFVHTYLRNRPTGRG
jgi:putative colanic acid biosynthesis glycosyltransferase